MEQFGDEGLRPDLDHRHHGPVAEGGVGFLAHGQHVGGRNFVTGKGTQYLGGDLGVGHGGERRNPFPAEGGPGLGDIEAAVGGQAAQHRVGEPHRRGFPTGRNIAHQEARLRNSMAA